MKKKFHRRNRKRFIIFGLIILIALACYLFWVEKFKDSIQVTVRREASSSKVQILEFKEKFQKEMQQPSVDIKESVKPAEIKDPCAEIETLINELFIYLDEKYLFRDRDETIGAQKFLNRLIEKMSAKPPIPAGEGLDFKIMSKNIFHFYNLLNMDELKLIKDLLKNEEETLEFNINIFYKWIIMKEDCPDSKKIRPAFGVLYRYAGFFLNTMGGRAYLFRRKVEIRLLISYYSLLIVHEADKSGLNNYGINLLPHVHSLADEISIYENLHFQKDYIERLEVLSEYYINRG